VFELVVVDESAVEGAGAMVRDEAAGSGPWERWSRDPPSP
jgi:hypothetical protein